MKSIVEAACESCPAILIGGHREIEGLKLLKTRPKYEFVKTVEGCCKGNWPDRILADTERTFRVPRLHKGSESGTGQAESSSQCGWACVRKETKARGGWYIINS